MSGSQLDNDLAVLVPGRKHPHGEVAASRTGNCGSGSNGNESWNCPAVAGSRPSSHGSA